MIGLLTDSERADAVDHVHIHPSGPWIVRAADIDGEPVHWVEPLPPVSAEALELYLTLAERLWPWLIRVH